MPVLGIHVLGKLHIGEFPPIGLSVVQYISNADVSMHPARLMKHTQSWMLDGQLTF